MDWKEALLKLQNEASEPQEPSSERQAKTRKLSASERRAGGLVYSTKPLATPPSEEEAEEEAIPADRQPLRLRMERAGRGGKTVTVISGFVGSKSQLETLARQLKQQLGTGGSVKEEEIVMQGDIRKKLLELLQRLGYKQVK